MTRVRCPLGGYAPCLDDLCYGGTTVCGLEPGADFCEHYRYPDDCPDCTDERFDDDGPPDDEYLMAMQEPPS